VGAAAVAPRPEGERSEHVNQFLGNQPDRWSTDQKSYSSIVYNNVQPGIDLIAESRTAGLEYSLRVAPGADPSSLHFRYEGAGGITVNEAGTGIEVWTEIGPLKESGLVCYQEGPEGRRPVEARYQVTGRNEYAIVLGSYDRDLPLTVDPMVTWSTHIGGTVSPYGQDDGYSIAADSSGNVFVAGQTFCVDFPASMGALSNSLKGTKDGFLMKLSNTGTPLWATYIGGSSDDGVNAVAVDSAGNAYVTGYTVSSDFFTNIGPPYAYYDAFVMKFNAGGTIAWSTFLGGNSLDIGLAIAVDTANNVYVGGYTYSSNFPTPGGFKPASSSGADGFVTKYNSSGAMQWSSIVGGNSADIIQGIAVDSSQAVYVTGYTYSTDFPTLGGLYTAINRGGAATPQPSDAFLTKIVPAGTMIAWSTYLGGSQYDYGYGVCVTADAAQDPVVVGTTSYTTDFPTTAGSWRSTVTNPTYTRTFVTRVLASGAGLVYSTFLGGNVSTGTNSYDYAQAIAAGPSGQVYVAGYTFSTDLYTTVGAYRTSWVGSADGFLTCLNPSGSSVLYSTYLGGSNYEYMRGVSVVKSGAAAGVYVTGTTYSTNYPLPVPAVEPNPILGGSADAFATVLPLNLSSVAWSTYVGGKQSLSSTTGYAVSVDPTAANTIYVCGTTTSLDFPTQAGLQTTLKGQQDLFLTKISTAVTKDPTTNLVTSAIPSIVWSTYWGGSDYDYGFGLTVDAAGYPYVVGYTYSNDFTLSTPALCPAWGSAAWNAAGVSTYGPHAFITEFNPTGGLYYSRYLAGNSSDYARSVAVDTSYNVFITGYTYSTNPATAAGTFPAFPATTGAIQTVNNGNSEAFVTKLNISGVMLWSTYLGGAGYEQGNGITCDSAGNNCYVTGYTNSGLPGIPFPANVPGATANLGNYDAFVTSLTAAGGLNWSRYLGGSNADYGNAIQLDPGGTLLYVTGYTLSADQYSPTPTPAFPTTAGSLKQHSSNYWEGFLTQIAAPSGAINWSTYLGGSSQNTPRAVAVGPSGNIFVTGDTWSYDFPNKGAVQASNAGYNDAFLIKVYPSGANYAWATYLGGNNYDYGYGVAVDSTGVLYVCGNTVSPNFPTQNALRASLGGTDDAFVVRFDDSAPDLPDFAAAGAGQFRADGVTPLAVGAWTLDANAVFKAKLTDSNDFMVKCEVDIQPVGVAFSGSDTTYFSAAFVPSGSLVSVTVPLAGTTPIQFHWRARAINGQGIKSAWHSFGGNPDPSGPDIGRDTVAPGLAIVSPTSSATYYTPANSIGLSGTDSDDASGVATVSWTNAANAQFGNANLSPGTWSIPSVPLNAGANLISLVAIDNAGNSTSSTPVQITIYFDNTPPSVAVTSNPPSFATNNGSLTLSGTASDNISLATVTWSNNRGGSGGAGIVGGTWSASISGLQLGTNVITITATDSAGNPKTTTETITYDNVPPTLAITSPANGFDTAAATVALSGTAGDNLALASPTPISWKNLANSQTGTTSVSGGIWSVASVPLQPGSNTIQVTATDSVGNQTSTSVLVYEDITLPSVAITSPATNPYITGASTVALAGNASDDVAVSTITWTCSTGGSGSGTLANPGAASSTWTIPSIALQLLPAVNTITVTATDEVGHIKTTSIDVKYDGTAPSVTITSPVSDPFFTNTVLGTIAVTGSASDTGTVNSISGSCTNSLGTTAFGVTPTPPTTLPASSFTWSGTATLAAGSNTIAITAQNGVGTPTTVTITVIYDTTPPAVKITGPTTADTYYSGSSLLTLAGTASDNQAVTGITWSTTGAVSPSSGGATGLGPWSVPIINLALGSQVITVTASDHAGNSKSTTLTVIYDPTLPSVAITAPTSAATYVTAASTVDLGGTSSDNSGIASVIWLNAANGTSGAASGTASWSVASIPLVAGDNPITAIASDLAGNIQVATITVSYDTALPTVKIKGPTALGSYSTNAPNVALSGTASDDTSVASVTWFNALTAAGGAASGTKNWSAAAIALLAGDNVITVTATDAVGNKSTDTITVTYDPTPPAVAILVPSSTGSFNTSITPVGLSGTANAFIGSSPTPVNVTRVSWLNVTTGGSGDASMTPGAWSTSVQLTTGSNGIQVTAYDDAGNSSTASITIVYDPAAPLVTITSPTNALTYTTATSPANLGGTALDDVGVVSVSWTTTANVTPSSGTATGQAAWNASIPLAVGTNTITVNATNVVGSIGTARVTITYDPIAPTIAITSPTSSPNYSTTISPLSLSGSAADNETVQTVTWVNSTTGASGTASGLGAWSIPSVALNVGDNLITVTATDEVGNTASASLTVNYDNIAPTVAIDPPAVSPPGPPYVTSSRPLLLTGTAGDNLALSSVTWTNSLGGGGTAATVGTATAVTWSASVYFVTGDNVITVTATDTHGLTTTSSVTVTFNPVLVAPTIQITGPTSTGSAVSATQQVALAGNADDVDPIVSVTWLNQATGVRGSAALTPIVGSPTGVNWTAGVPLANGVNVIIVTATDDAGNSTPSTITVTYQSISDAVDPAITVTGPTITGVYDDSVSPLLITLDATDNVGVASITWSNPSTGGAGTASWQSGNTWTVSIAMAVGANTLTFTAYDPSGNHASAVLVVNFVPVPGDIANPVVSITSYPTNVSLDVSTALLDLAGIASDNVKVAEIVWFNAADNATGDALGTDTWSASLILQPGVNVITMRAFDTSGNTSTDQLTVVYTPPPPPPPPPVHIAAGACGLLGLEVCLPLIAAWAVRRRRREGKGSQR
jgi:hypothetical protein